MCITQTNARAHVITYVGVVCVIMIMIIIVMNIDKNIHKCT